MRKIFLFIIICTSLNNLFSQTELSENETSQKLLILENQLNTIKSKIAENRLDSLYVELGKLVKEKSKQNTNTTIIQDNINKIQKKLQEREDLYTQLQNEFTNISLQIKNTTNSISGTVETQISQKLDELKNESIEIRKDLTRDNSIKFKTISLTWYDLGQQILAISNTAKSILLFDVETAKKANNTWQEIGKYAGIVGGIAGAVIASDDEKAGIMTSGISLSFTTLITTLFKKKNNQKLIENISRNVAFTDEINSFYKVASTFGNKTKILYEDVKPHQHNNDWIPSLENVTEFYTLISLRRDLTVIIRQMRAKAQHLLSLSVTNEGKTQLTQLIKDYDSALESWEASETVYLSTYNYLFKVLSEN
ncbi:hypothetical protein [Tenacibaculum sp. IB213877]|uniref:hypothetical protein n=1 Tax=Tenacibaculum sp. IB213877 TaxID=3097351 RepID=UPI002A59B14E|nr:hypothetical protein [Tenacibaculum sp. IB213877]MDY0779388.1 hypothetical protein [Tenacibaculum sp. IB213877]